MEKSLNLPRKYKEKRKLKLNPVVSDLAQLQRLLNLEETKLSMFFKGCLISEGIFNLAPSSKNVRNHCFSTCQPKVISRFFGGWDKIKNMYLLTEIVNFGKIIEIVKGIIKHELLQYSFVNKVKMDQ